MKWALAMTWVDLLFAHWPLEPEDVQRVLPAPLEVETFAGKAWVGVVPFRMADVHFRSLPSIPTTRTFPELNVRTYVRTGGESGVYFFSLDAASMLAVMGGRSLHLRYMEASMSCERNGDEVTYWSHRTHAGQRAADLRGRYGPTGPAFRSEPGSLEHWLTDRYSLIATDGRGAAWRLDIAHEPWQLRTAQATFEVNTMAEACGLTLPPTEPHLLFADRMAVKAMTPVRIAAAAEAAM